MKAFLEVVKFNVNDVVTASGSGGGCTYEDCPGLEWNEEAIEG